VDLFLLGVNRFDYSGLNEKELFIKITKGYYSFPEHLSSQSKEIIKKILVVNSSNRPSVEAVRSLLNNRF
jgi:hypothetical protein